MLEEWVESEGSSPFLEAVIVTLLFSLNTRQGLTAIYDIIRLTMTLICHWQFGDINLSRRHIISLSDINLSPMTNN